MAASMRASHFRICRQCQLLQRPLISRRFSTVLSNPAPTSTASSTLSLEPISKPTPLHASRLQKQRTYYTSTSTATPPPLYPPTETAILAAAYTHIPAHGFTTQSLLMGLHDTGYPPSALNLFPRGAFELLLYHLATQRLALASANPAPAPSSDADAATLWTTTTQLLQHRLHANEPILAHLPAALAQIPQPAYLPTALAELGRLADDVVHLSGATALDSRWYARRAGVAAVYAASELFMTQDASPGWSETDGFVARRVEGLRAGEEGLGAVGEWIGFSAGSAVNLVRSWGWRV